MDISVAWTTQHQQLLVVLAGLARLRLQFCSLMRRARGI